MSSVELAGAESSKEPDDSTHRRARGRMSVFLQAWVDLGILQEDAEEMMLRDLKEREACRTLLSWA